MEQYYTAKVNGRKFDWTVRVWFNLSNPKVQHLNSLLEEALSEKETEKRDHNLLWVYRQYLDCQEYPSLPRHRYMYDHLPNGPYSSKDE